MGKEAECPICSAYIPVEPEAKEGEMIYCSYCGTQLMIKHAELRDTEDKDQKVEVEEDWG